MNTSKSEAVAVASGESTNLSPHWVSWLTWQSPPTGFFAAIGAATVGAVLLFTAHVQDKTGADYDSIYRFWICTPLGLLWVGVLAIMVHWFSKQSHRAALKSLIKRENVAEMLIQVRRWLRQPSNTVHTAEYGPVAKVEAVTLQMLYQADNTTTEPESPTAHPLADSFVVPPRCYCCMSTENLAEAPLSFSAESRAGNTTTTRTVTIKLSSCAACRGIKHCLLDTSGVFGGIVMVVGALLGAIVTLGYSQSTLTLFGVSFPVWQLYAPAFPIAVVLFFLEVGQPVDALKVECWLGVPPVVMSMGMQGRPTLAFYNSEYSKLFWEANPPTK